MFLLDLGKFSRAKFLLEVAFLIFTYLPEGDIQVQNGHGASAG